VAHDSGFSFLYATAYCSNKFQYPASHQPEKLQGWGGMVPTSQEWTFTLRHVLLYSEDMVAVYYYHYVMPNKTFEMKIIIPSHVAHLALITHPSATQQ
jgi:hypothetical protein